MIFQHTWEQVLRGEKTQTRRLVKDGETLERNYILSDGTLSPTVVFTAKGRVKWAVGRTYAVQPGRGKKQIARIRLTDIRQERLQNISIEDVRSEGVSPAIAPYAHYLPYRQLWDTIHNRPGERWIDNPLVWVLEFEVVDA